MQNQRPSKIRAFAAALLLQSLLASATRHAAADDRQDKKQEYQAAKIKLQNTLLKNPGDKDALQQLGMLSLEWGNGQMAEKEFRRAIELGVPQEKLQFALAEALLIQGKNQEILDYLAPMALMSAQDQAKLLSYRGDAWLGLKQPEKAKTEYGIALQMDPDTPLAKLGLARIDLSSNRLEDAQKRVSEVLQSAPGEPKAWSLQGALFEASKQPEKAEESYGKAIALKRFSPVERASRAIIRVNTDKLSEAQADFDALKQESPEFFLTYYTAGLLNLKQGKYADAQNALEHALKMNDRFESVYYYLGIAHLYQNHDYEAEKHFVDFMNRQPQALEPRLFMALLKFRGKDKEAARALLAPVLEKQPDNAFALRLMSNIEFADGNHAKGFEYLGRIPAAPEPASQAVGRADVDLMKAGDENQLVGMLNKAHEIDQKLAQQLTALVLGKIADKDFRNAEDLIDRIKLKARDNPLADNLLGLTRLAQGATEKAKEAFESALDKSPGDPVITHELAQLAVKENNTAQARRLYDKALVVHPKSIPTRIHLAELDGFEGNTQAMKERLVGIIHDYPTALPARMILASYFLTAGDPGHAESLLEAVQQGYSSNVAFMTLLIHAQLESHQFDKAAASAKRLVQNDPQYAMGHYLLARAYAELKDTANLRPALDRAIAADPGFLPARYTRVRLLAEEGKMPEASAELERLAKQYPDSAEAMTLRGWLAAAQDKPAEAVSAYRAAFEKFPGAKTATDLAEAEWKAGGGQAAIQTLEAWIGAHPDDAPPRLMVAEFYVARKNNGAAIRHLEAIFKSHPDNILVMNNLAWLYRESAPEKALEIAKEAAAIAPKSPVVLDTLAMVELGQGRADKALKWLKRAAELAPQHKPIQYHLALAMDKTGHGADAVRILQELQADPRPFPGQKDAKALLDKLSAH